jgi:hypothetical protein
MRVNKVAAYCFLHLLLGLGLNVVASGQIGRLTLANELKILAADRNLAIKLLSANTFSVSEEGNTQTFYRVNENVEVEYSTGNCVAANAPGLDWDLGSDIWNVPTGRIVRVVVEPKQPMAIEETGIDLSQFKKQEVYANRKYPVIYFNRKEGIALRVWSGSIQRIEYLPAENQYDQLCANDVMRNVLSRRNLFLTEPGPSPACVLYNQPANVRSVSVEQLTTERPIFNVGVTADDPENDVLTYTYRVQAGRIEGVGARTVWNLEGAPKGTYEIKVAVDDGTGPRGLWASRLVTIK